MAVNNKQKNLGIDNNWRVNSSYLRKWQSKSLLAIITTFALSLGQTSIAFSNPVIEETTENSLESSLTGTKTPISIKDNEALVNISF